MVPGKHLVRISGMNQMMSGIKHLVAPLLGALLVMLAPIHYVLLIDVGTALIAIVPLLFILIPQPETKGEKEEEESVSFLHTFREGLRYLANSKGLLLLFIYISGLRLFAIGAWRLTPLLVTQHFKGMAVHLGIFTSSFGAGLVGGGLLLSIWGGFKSKIRTTYAGWFVAGITMTVIGFMPSDSFWFTVPLAAMFGAAFSIYGAPIKAIIQTSVPPEMQGRIFAFHASALALMKPIGLGICGYLGEIWNIRYIYILGGATILLFFLAAILTPSVRRIEDSSGADSAAGRQPTGQT